LTKVHRYFESNNANIISNHNSRRFYDYFDICIELNDREMIKSICVYCGSSGGNSPIFLEAAKQLGEALADQSIKLVYGGAKIGVMGQTANTCLAKGGEVLGVIPDFLSKVEISHEGLTELIKTETMHERKTLMAERSDGFIALPGGFGTLEELAEILTWNQLGLVNKPIGILNVNGYYDKLLAFFDDMLENGFLKKESLTLFVVDSTVDGLLLKMKDFEKANYSFEEKLGL